MALNAAFLMVTRTTQSLDATGVAAAAHAITIQLWQLGGVVLLVGRDLILILTLINLKYRYQLLRYNISVPNLEPNWS